MKQQLYNDLVAVGISIVLWGIFVSHSNQLYEFSKEVRQFESYLFSRGVGALTWFEVALAPSESQDGASAPSM